MRTVSSIQWYARRERSGSVCNNEDPVSNDDEKWRIQKGTRKPEGLFSLAAPRVTAHSFETDVKWYDVL